MNSKTGFLLFFLSFFNGHFASGNATIPFSAREIEGHLAEMETTIDLCFDVQFEKRIKKLVTRGKKGMELYLGRSARYFPVIEAKLAVARLPMELKYLTVVESGLEPKVVSEKGAAGLWQLMKTTGRGYGLLINAQVDERLDLNRSTDVALAFLKDLYLEFGDWTLAIAAYNCGPVRLRAAIERRKSHDFWKIKSLLPKQTREYVEKFTAMAYLMNYYSFYDLRPRYPDYNLQMTQMIKVYSRKSFAELAQEIGIPVAVLQELNPSYLAGFVPARRDGSNLILPIMGIRSDFLPEGMQLFRV